MKIRKMNMNILWKKMMQRYKNMGNLLVAVLCIMLGIVLHYSPSIVKHVMAGGDELLLGGVYACNLLTLIILCINIIRIDCRNLLSEKTAGLLEWMGISTILLMLIRDQFARRATHLAYETLYSMDWTTLMFMGMILLFVGKIVRRAIKIKEENDLTI